MDRGSAVVGADGWVLSAPVARDGTAWADVDLRASRDRRLGELGHLWLDRRPDLGGALLEPVGPVVVQLLGPRAEVLSEVRVEAAKAADAAEAADGEAVAAGA